MADFLGIPFIDVFEPEGRAAGQQFAQQRPEAENIAPGIDVRAAFRLFRAHVGRRADELAGLRDRLIRLKIAGGGLGDSEVDHLGLRPAVMLPDEHVGRLDIAMNHALLVRVLDRLANEDEQLQALAQAKALAVAEIRDLLALHQLHHEIRPSGRGAAGIQNPRDVRMVHQGQRLDARWQSGRSRSRCPSRGG